MEKNEITVKIACDIPTFQEELLKKGFSLKGSFHMEDTYFIPCDIDVTQMSVREILKKAILIRDIHDADWQWHTQQYTFKKKEFDEAGNILHQSSVTCEVKDISSAKLFLEAIGYREIMCIIEDDMVYAREEMEIPLKVIKGGDCLIEIETNEQFDTIEKVKSKLKELDLPVNTEDYFIKKAEIELSTIRDNLFCF